MSEPGADWGGVAFDADGRLVDLHGAAEVVTYGPPPPLRWVPVADLPHVTGRRACLMTASGPVFDVRCASEVFSSGGGRYLHLVYEDQWYRWLDADPAIRPAGVPRATCVGARHVWVAAVDYPPDRPS